MQIGSSKASLFVRSALFIEAHLSVKENRSSCTPNPTKSPTPFEMDVIGWLVSHKSDTTGQ